MGKIDKTLSCSVVLAYVVFEQSTQIVQRQDAIPNSSVIKFWCCYGQRDTIVNDLNAVPSSRQ